MNEGIDFTQLDEALQGLARELSVPYTERRNSKPRRYLREDLSDALEEIEKRERELRAAIGIATYLRENNIALQRTISSLESTDFSSKLSLVKTEMKELKIELEKKTKEVLVKNELVFKFEARIKELKSQLEKTNRLRESERETQGNQSENIESLNKLKRNFSQQSKKLQNLQSEKAKLQERYAVLGKENQSLAAATHKLNAELRKTEEENLSLKEELDRFLKNTHTPKMTFDPNNSQFDFNIDFEPVFKIETKENTSIQPKAAHKNPIPEYFKLTTQAVKLNSPYVDDVYPVNHYVLYEKALKKQVPFHKWHQWIEKELNSIYKKKKQSGCKTAPLCRTSHSIRI